MPTYDDNKLKDILTNAHVIAVVGHSNRPDRPSYRIASYLRSVGYKVYAVNPRLQEIDGEKVYANLAEIPEPIDIVDVFRRAHHLDGVVDEAIEVGAKMVWGQFGVEDFQAAVKAEAAGLDMIMDRCILVEHQRLVNNPVLENK